MVRQRLSCAATPASASLSLVMEPILPTEQGIGASQVQSVRSSEEASVCSRQESIHGTSVLRPLLAALTAEFLHAKLNTTP